MPNYWCHIYLSEKGSYNTSGKFRIGTVEWTLTYMAGDRTLDILGSQLKETRQNSFVYGTE